MGDDMPRSLPCALLLAAAILSSSAAARADDPPPNASAPGPSSRASVLAALQAPEPAPAPRKTRSSYYPTLGIAEAFIGLVYAGTGNKAPQVKGTLFSLVVPVVHTAHGNGRRGFISLGLRLGLAYSGFFLAGGGNHTCHSYCHDPEGMIGFAAGYVAAAIIDYAFLSHDPPRKRAPTRWWAPTAAAAPGGASIGVVGGF